MSLRSRRWRKSLNWVTFSLHIRAARSRNGSYTSQTATGETSGWARKLRQSPVPCPPHPIIPTLTLSLAPITLDELIARHAPAAKVLVNERLLGEFKRPS